MTNRPFAIGVAAAALAANALFIQWGRHTFMPLGIVWVSAVLLGILLLVLTLILRAFNKARPDPAAQLSIKMSIASAVVCFSLLPSVPILKYRHRIELESARARAEALIPALEAHREATGSYPYTLQTVAGSDPLPWLLTEADAYRSTGTGYILQVRHPGHPFAANERRHTENRWRLTK